MICDEFVKCEFEVLGTVRELHKVKRSMSLLCQSFEVVQVKVASITKSNDVQFNWERESHLCGII